MSIKIRYFATSIEKNKTIDFMPRVKIDKIIAKFFVDIKVLL
jgi:hypothetical protein